MRALDVRQHLQLEGAVALARPGGGGAGPCDAGGSGAAGGAGGGARQYRGTPQPAATAARPALPGALYPAYTARCSDPAGDGRTLQTAQPPVAARLPLGAGRTGNSCRPGARTLPAHPGRIAGTATEFPNCLYADVSATGIRKLSGKP